MKKHLSAVRHRNYGYVLISLLAPLQSPVFSLFLPPSSFKHFISATVFWPASSTGPPRGTLYQDILHLVLKWLYAIYLTCSFSVGSCVQFDLNFLANSFIQQPQDNLSGHVAPRRTLRVSVSPLFGTFGTFGTFLFYL